MEWTIDVNNCNVTGFRSERRTLAEQEEDGDQHDGRFVIHGINTYSLGFINERVFDSITNLRDDVRVMNTRFWKIGVYDWNDNDRIIGFAVVVL